MRRKRQYSEFGLWAKGILMELNMTQTELAQALGAGRSTVSDVFTGRTKDGGFLQERISNYLEGKDAENNDRRGAV